MTWDRVQRLLGGDNLARLATKKVAVIGCGSGGSFAALALAMSGVGAFALIDDDILEPTNIVRHAADARYLGQHKAHAVADLIRQRNPAAHVDVEIGRFEDHPDILEGVDLVVSGIDNEPSKYVLNQACLSRNLTAVYAGVYERGEGGDVAVIEPYITPCYACWAAQLRDDMASAKTDESAELDYGMIGKEGTLDAEPGLWLHVTRIAGAQADIALNQLLRGTPIWRALPGNTVILANAALEIVEGVTSLPYSAVWATIERDPDCLVCGDHVRAELHDDDSRGALSLDALMRDAGLTLEESQDSNE
jgi:molybdopterin/thiamine biosynthesis adenylyltransferase